MAAPDRVLLRARVITRSGARAWADQRAYLVPHAPTLALCRSVRPVPAGPVDRLVAVGPVGLVVPVVPAVVADLVVPVAPAVPALECVPVAVVALAVPAALAVPVVPVVRVDLVVRVGLVVPAVGAVAVAVGSTAPVAAATQPVPSASPEVGPRADANPSARSVKSSTTWRRRPSVVSGCRAVAAKPSGCRVEHL